MMRRLLTPSVLSASLALSLALACAHDDGPPPRLPDVAAATFVDGVDNPYFPLPVGARWVYEAKGEDGTERIEVSVLPETRVVNGVTAVVVRDTVTVNGEVVEDTWDWYAQDSEGNVWYLGEDTCEFEAGECVSKAGAWEWGKEGALPGLVMPAHPAVDGDRYYQEFKEGEAEDAGEVVAVGLSVTVPAGTYSDCIKTHDTSTLDRDLDEHKYYCAGVGVVKVEEPDATEALLEVSGI
ncbi:MAG: hypothetical protein KC420_17285 [Myxococcales bacterium]|nr:hypothetical protein [Myxococcales bacterium]